MPRPCTVCTHPELAAISKAIVQGGSKRTIAARFGVSDAAVLRHKHSCLNLRPAPKSSIEQNEKSGHPAPLAPAGGSVRFGSDAGGITGPGDLLARLERLLRIGEMLDAALDRKDVDAVVKLSREYRAAVESYAKVAGWLSDGTTVNVDARRLSIAEAKVAALSESDLRDIRALAQSLNGQNVPDRAAAPLPIIAIADKESTP